MNYYTIVAVLALVLLIISLTLYGVFYKKFIISAFPETQDPCPKRWTIDPCGNCIRPSIRPTQLNNLDLSSNNTPSTAILTSGRFNPNDSGWESWDGAKSSICGKKKWSDSNKIEWNGISNYNSC